MRRRWGAAALGLLLLLLQWETAGSAPGAAWFFDKPPESVLRFLESGLQPRTRQLYWREWFTFLRRTGISSVQWETLSDRAKDYLISDYMVQGRSAEEDDDKLSKTEAGYLLSLLRLREPFETYRLSHRVLNVWKIRDPPLAAWPATPELTEALAAFMALAGQHGGSVAVLLCFVGLLRISEALNAEWTSVFLPAEEAIRQEGTLHLPSTKRGEAYVPLTDPNILAVLRRQRRRTGGKGKVCGGLKYGAFRKLLQAGLRAVQVPERLLKVFRTHSFRRGGATWVLQQTRSVEYVVVLGRWASLLSARRYLKQGEALLARFLAETSVEMMLRMEALRTHMADLLM